jgi:hypothetical protein
MSTRLIRKQTELPYDEWHFDVYDLAACPFCGHADLVVRSIRHRTEFYVTHYETSKCEGTIEGPRRGTKGEAGKAFNEAMKRFSASFQAGRGGEW